MHRPQLNDRHWPARFLVDHRNREWLIRCCRRAHFANQECQKSPTDGLSHGIRRAPRLMFIHSATFDDAAILLTSALSREPSPRERRPCGGSSETRMLFMRIHYDIDPDHNTYASRNIL